MKTPPLLPAGLGLSLCLCLSACAGGSAERAPASSTSATPPAPSPSAPTPPPVAAPPAAENRAASPVVVTYVEINRAWVEEHTQAPPALVKAWAADPVHLASVLPMTRHILVQSSSSAPPADRAAARKKALAALARVTRGEDFAKVAREVSEDPGSKDKGGAYPGEMVEQFVEPYRVAYAALAPGKITKDLVETQFGFHVIKKDLVDDAALAAAYRRATAIQTTRRLADELVERLKPTRAEASATRHVNEVMTAALGSEAVREAAAPSVSLVPLAQLPPPPRGDTCTKLVATPPGTVTLMPLPDEHGFIVSKAGPESDVDPSVRATKSASLPEDVLGYCRPGSANTLSVDDIRALIEKAQRAQKKK